MRLSIFHAEHLKPLKLFCNSTAEITWLVTGTPGAMTFTSPGATKQQKRAHFPQPTAGHITPRMTTYKLLLGFVCFFSCLLDLLDTLLCFLFKWPIRHLPYFNSTFGWITERGSQKTGWNGMGSVLPSRSLHEWSAKKKKNYVRQCLQTHKTEVWSGVPEVGMVMLWSWISCLSCREKTALQTYQTVICCVLQLDGSCSKVRFKAATAQGLCDYTRYITYCRVKLSTRLTLNWYLVPRTERVDTSTKKYWVSEAARVGGWHNVRPIWL